MKVAYDRLILFSCLMKANGGNVNEFDMNTPLVVTHCLSGISNSMLLGANLPLRHLYGRQSNPANKKYQHLSRPISKSISDLFDISLRPLLLNQPRRRVAVQSRCRKVLI